MKSIVLTCFLTGIFQVYSQSGYAPLKDGARLYYDMRGTGQPLVLIAGGPGDAHDYFKPYFSGFEKKFKVIYYDARGRGRSQSSDTVFSAEQDVSDLNEFLAHLKTEKTHILGHSYGGIVAQKFVISHPEKTMRVILCNTFHSAGGWKNNIDNCNRHIMESFPDQWAKLTLLRDNVKSSDPAWRLIYDPCINTLYWYNMSNFEAFILANINKKIPPFSYPVYYSIIGNDPDISVSGTMKALDLRKDLALVHNPVLVIAGRADKIATVKQAFEIQQLIPNSRIHIFNRSGHLPFVEENDLFTDVITEFLTQS